MMADKPHTTLEVVIDRIDGELVLYAKPNPDPDAPITLDFSVENKAGLEMKSVQVDAGVVGVAFREPKGDE